MVKRVFTLLIAMLTVFGLAASAHAALILRGTDTLGHRLIYDDDLDITWYDYTHPVDSWQNQVDWAGTLTVEFNGIIYDDWRLPSIEDAPYVFGYDGTTTAGYNITTSEMGHLFYTELGNLGSYDTDGNPLSSYGLTNTGDFQHLIAGSYWSGTADSFDIPDHAWYFNFDDGLQNKFYMYEHRYAIAVRPGDVAAGGGGPAPIPEPS
ncbi:MAG: DUF1566 domain-containing protein, partial [Chloroflexi bacterium]